MSIEPRQVQRTVEAIRPIVPLRMRTRVEQVKDAEGRLHHAIAKPDITSELDLEEARCLVANLAVRPSAVREAPRGRERVGLGPAVREPDRRRAIRRIA